MITCRYLNKIELSTLYEKNILPKDVANNNIVGVSEICNFSLIIEDKKIEGISQQELEANCVNISKEVERGRVWILELTSDGLSRLLLDDDFYEMYCDKKGNPYTLSQRISLHYDDSYSFWTENVYIEAFDND